MTPDRMVIDEAMRTFTYLSLYGYLTDAVVVNRVFPDEVEGGYFGAWRDGPARAARARRVRLRPRAGAARALLRAGGARRDDARPPRRGAVRGRATPARVLHDTLAQELVARRATARALRLDIPFTDKGDISLKKIGLELIVRVDGQKRTIILPPALAPYRPSSASFSDGSLLVSFSG